MKSTLYNDTSQPGSLKASPATDSQVGWAEDFTAGSILSVLKLLVEGMRMREVMADVLRRPRARPGTISHA